MTGNNQAIGDGFDGMPPLGTKGSGKKRLVNVPLPLSEPAQPAPQASGGMVNVTVLTSNVFDQNGVRHDHGATFSTTKELADLMTERKQVSLA